MRMLLPLLLVVCALLLQARAASANVVVTIQSVLGPIDLELFDTVAPLTVANFLTYTDPVGAAYDQSFIHRSVPGFVIQGGGYRLVGLQIFDVATNPPSVLNEPGLSNVRGTVAMAKLAGLPNSATTQWFINVGHNVALDTDNGGFTVFARRDLRHGRRGHDQQPASCQHRLSLHGAPDRQLGASQPGVA